LVHGEKTNMMRLKSKLLSLNANKSTPVKVFSPANCEELRIPFRQDKIAKVVGRLANQIQISTAPPSPPTSDEEGTRDEKKFKTTSGDQVVSGVLVQNDFKLSLMAPEDLKEYAGLTTTTILCRQRLTLAAAGIDLIKWALEGTFGAIETISSPTKDVKAEASGNGAAYEEADEELQRHQETVFEVMGSVRVKVADRGEVEVEWEGNISNDGIADAVLAVLFTVESSPAAVKREFLLRDYCVSLILTELQNHRVHIHTTIMRTSATSTHTSALRKGSHVYACSSKPSLARTPLLLSQDLSSTSPKLMMPILLTIL
jgi:cleavage and polyadenylation specificity factor subunit 3